MCGIFGASTKLDYEVFKDVLRVTSHRGPDNTGIFIDENVSLGHNRLSIIDISANSNQPMQDATGKYHIIYNGELYNFIELRESLKAKGYKFYSNGDAEVILYSFIEYGPQCVQNFDGIFAFSIYDLEAKTLSVFRDSLGVKPLYYTLQNGIFYFASELKSFKVLGLLTNCTVNVNAIYQTLGLLYTPNPNTLLKEIHKLPPSSYLQFDLTTSEHSVNKYSLSFEPVDTSQFPKAVEKSVEDQMLADVPVGAFLSGGVDSSIICKYASEHSKQKKLNAYTVKTTDQKRDPDGNLSDLPFAIDIAKRLNMSLTQVEDTLPSIEQKKLKNLLFDLVYDLDEPNTDFSGLHVDNITKIAKQDGVKVMLSGAGADDIFAGYRRHWVANSLLMKMPDIPKVYHGLLKLSSFLPDVRFVRRIRKILISLSKSQQERVLSLYLWCEEREIRDLFNESRQDELSLDVFSAQKSILGNKDVIKGMLDFEKKYYLPDHNLLYVDKMSMKNSVEVRVPFLSNILLAFSQQLPSRKMVDKSVTKIPLKDLSSTLFGRKFTHREKSGFGSPTRSLVKGALAPVISEILSKDNVEKRGVFDFEKIQSLIALNQSGKVDTSYTILSLTFVEIWFQIFVDDNKGN